MNEVTFFRYECRVCCAIKLWIKHANNAVPSDDVGYVVKSLCGNINRTTLTYQNFVPQIRRHSQGGVRSTYISVYVNKNHWAREASRVYYAWLK